MSIDNFSARIVLRKDVIRNDGTTALLIRVIINRKVGVFPTGVYVKPMHFDDVAKKVIIPDDKKLSQSYNLLLQQYLGRANNIMVDFRLKQMTATLTDFRVKFNNQNFKLDFIEFMKKETKALDHVFTYETIKSYKQTIAWLERFFDDGLPFSHLTSEYMYRFVNFLKKNKLSPNTVYKHVKNIKKFINLSENLGLKVDNPFKNLQVRQVKNDKEALTLEQLQKLIDLYKQPMPEKMKNVLAMFLFSSFAGGLRFCDLQLITSESFTDDYLIYAPKKLRRFNRIVKIPIIPMFQQFISKNRGVCFAPVSNAYANKVLKIIQHEADIPTKLTMHLARHTYATLFISSGGDVYSLMSVMGISKMDTVQCYVHMSNNRKKELVNNFADFVLKGIRDL